MTFAHNMFTVAWALKYWIIPIALFLTWFFHYERQVQEIEAQPVEIDPLERARWQYNYYTEDY